jgi:aminopeptidase N
MISPSCSFFLPGQPVSPPTSHPYEIHHSFLNVILDFQKRLISGTAKLECSLSSPVENIILDAVGMKFESVKVNSRNCRFKVTNTELEILLEPELSVGDMFEIILEYSAMPQKGLYFGGPAEPDSGGIRQEFVHSWPNDSRYWYPCFDHPSMRSSTETTVTLPESMIAVSNGKLVSVVNSGNGLKSWHFVQDVPHPPYVRSIVAGDMIEIKDSWEGLPLEYFVLSNRSKDEALRTFGNTPRMLGYFSKIIGTKYPYAKYAQTAVGFTGGGTEAVSATIVSDEILHDARAHADYENGEDVVAHELAHQWFGDYLTCKDWSHAWLNEGFATYFTALYRRSTRGEDNYCYFMNYPYRESFLEEYKRYARPIVTNRYWDPEEIFDRHAYEKGAWVLHLLRGILGDRKFFDSINLYVSKHKNSSVETEDFKRCVEEVSGHNLGSFFEEWLYSPGIPDYDVSYSWNHDRKEIALAVEQKNAGKENIPLFSNPIEIKLTFENKSEIKVIRMSAPKEVFVFVAEEEPRNVSFDPNDWILKILDFHKPLQMSLYQLLDSSSSVMEQIWAIWEISRHPQSEEVLAALEKVVEDSRFWGVQFEAAKVLGSLKSEVALRFLLSAKDDADLKIRRGVAFALRNFADIATKTIVREEIISCLIWLLNNDDSYYVRANAVWSLGLYNDDERAYNAMKSALEQDSVIDIVRTHAFKGFAEKSDARAIPLALDYAKNGNETHGKVAAISYLGKVSKHDSQKIKDFLFEMKDALDPRLKTEAVVALGNLEDPKIITLLQSWLETEIYGGVRRKLRELIYQLEQIKEVFSPSPC